jgi:rare lipoprotein A
MKHSGLLIFAQTPFLMKRLFFLFLILSFFYRAEAQVQTGKASFYADKFEGQPTASGEKYKRSKLTAAHKTLPFGTKVRITNIANNQTVDVVINDRGPYVDGRIIDVSRAAAEKLGFINQGLADVSLEIIDPGDGKRSDPAAPIGQVSVDEKEFYNFEVARLKPSGFGVQIGTYQEMVNLIRLSENLKNSYRKKVTVQVKIINGVKYYSLILGQFPSREKAQQFRNELSQKFPDAFIIEFSKI